VRVHSLLIIQHINITMELTTQVVLLSALFTLAMYCTASEACLTQNATGSNPGAWGLPFDEICRVYCDPRLKPRHASAWGWHSMAPGGICGGVFDAAGLKASTCPGLLSLVDAIAPLTNEDSKQNLLGLVESYARILDSGLQFGVRSQPGHAGRPSRRNPQPGRIAHRRRPVTPNGAPQAGEGEGGASDSPAAARYWPQTAHAEDVRLGRRPCGAPAARDSPDAMARIDAENAASVRSSPRAYCYQNPPSHPQTSTSTSPPPNPSPPLSASSQAVSLAPAL
jgi:hypothetical protein